MPYLLAPVARGLGVLDYYGLLAQADLQDCDPRDSACVSNNVAKQAAVEDLWVSKYMVTGAPDDLKLNFTDQTAGQVQEFYNPNPLALSNVVDTRGILTYDTSTTDPVRYVPPNEPSFKPALPPPPPKPSASQPANPIKVPPARNPVTGELVSSDALSTVGGFSFGSIPWWGWLGAAGVAVFAMRGSR